MADVLFKFLSLDRFFVPTKSKRINGSVEYVRRRCIYLPKFLDEITEAPVEKTSLLYSDIQRIRLSTVKTSPAVFDETASQSYGAEEIDELSDADNEGELRRRITEKLEARRRDTLPF